jgi:uncharacterized protein YecE (DUF72 family)
MIRYLIGTGGWAYFRVPGLRPLVAYSKAFNFVEVNSTFYEIPSLKTVEKWRRVVPSDFEFSVRCNKQVTHTYKFRRAKRAFEVFNRMVGICKTLNAEVLHLQIPPKFRLTSANVNSIRNFLGSTSLKGLRIALEVRGKKKLGRNILKLMHDYNMIHCVDLSKNEEPALKSDVLYTRLFGRGEHNIYQPTDEELREIDRRISEKEYKTVMVSFHFIRMYKDAARFKIFKETGNFPMVTRSTGVRSLAEVLREDARFPATKEELICHQGWKLVDFSRERRVRASYFLKKLPEKTYKSVGEVVQALRSMGM